MSVSSTHAGLGSQVLAEQDVVVGAVGVEALLGLLLLLERGEVQGLVLDVLPAVGVDHVGHAVLRVGRGRARELGRVDVVLAADERAVAEAFSV